MPGPLVRAAELALTFARALCGGRALSDHSRRDRSHGHEPDHAGPSTPMAAGA